MVQLSGVAVSGVAVAGEVLAHLLHQAVSDQGSPPWRRGRRPQLPHLGPVWLPSRRVRRSSARFRRPGGWSTDARTTTVEP